MPNNNNYWGLKISLILLIQVNPQHKHIHMVSDTVCPVGFLNGDVIASVHHNHFKPLFYSLSLCSLVQIITYTKGSVRFGKSQFKGRVGFREEMPTRDVTLYINNTQESDSGRYTCQVIMPDRDGLTGEITLDVKGKTPRLYFTWWRKTDFRTACFYNLTKWWFCNPLLSVPPAVPKCSLSGKPVLKGNVTLSCKSSSGKPIPIYKWQKTSPTSEVFFSPMLSEWC